MSLRRVLVANRGEIACRVMRTLRARGLESAAVFSEADADAPHVRLADRAQLIGPAPAPLSYLDADKVLAAARDMGCDAVHPGYGFLSENAAFAEACADAGMTFIGPPVAAIRAMGDKAQARRAALDAGVSPVPGYAGDDDDGILAREAERIGYPVLVKAALGGGGKGMRLVEGAGGLADAIRAARREAQAAFGDGSLLLERYVHPARHIEVQLLADTHGRAIPVLERECSLQRRHQKVVEECPSSAIDDPLRERLGDAAARLALAVGYIGAGTVEFLVEEDGSFWFLEMNTRLQVEHGVTEMVTGEDLVAWQLRIADGEALDLPTPVTPRGWAVEARVYAEDPSAGFLPQAGTITHLALPTGPGVRVDVGVRGGQEITPHYDPMLMKVLAHGSDRVAATGRLRAALEDLHLLGPKTNVGYLLDVLASDAWTTGQTFTHTLEADGVASTSADGVPPEVLMLAAWGLEMRRRPESTDAARGDVYSAFDRLSGFRIVPRGGDA